MKTETEVSSGVVSLEEEKTFSFAGYVANGGLIDEKNYERVMQQARNNMPYASRVNMAGVPIDQTAITAEISNNINCESIGQETGIDPRCIFDILRTDVKPTDVQSHHGAMSDQALFVEALRMLSREKEVRDVMVAHPNIWSKPNVESTDS